MWTLRTPGKEGSGVRLPRTWRWSLLTTRADRSLSESISLRPTVLSRSWLMRRGRGDETAALTHTLEMSRLVSPDDAVLGTLMFAGRLMMHLDEVASLLALRFCRCPIVTASIDALAFFAPIRVGEIVAYQAGLNYVGRTSMEIGVRVLAAYVHRLPHDGARRCPRAAPARPTIPSHDGSGTTPLGSRGASAGAPGPPALAPARG